MKILTLIVLSVALMCLLEGVDSQKKMKKRKALLKGIPKECRKLMRKQKKKKHATAQQINSCLNATVFEGDVKLTDRQQKLIDTLIGKYNKTDQEAHSIMKRGASAYSGKWTEYKIGNNYIVPYIIDGSMSAKGSRLVERASELLAAVTCLRLMPRSEPTVQKNYIRYFVGGGCYSYVGKVGGRQDISIGRGCEYESTVVHETMHALGFWHEQSRKDRDKYVRVLLENVLPGTEFNFEKYEHGEIDSLGSPYDTMSVMHYDGYAFSKNRKPTIVDKDNGQQRFSIDPAPVSEANMNTSAMLLLAFCALSSVQASRQSDMARANPIRKVVTMLQGMQKKVEAEGEAELKLFEKYMCYCKNSGGDLSKSISDADTKIPQLGSDIKEGEAKKKQLDEDIKQHQVDRSAAKTAMADATALREKEAAAYAKESSEDAANIAATEKATTAIEKGMGSAFLQTPTASVLRQLAQKRQEDELVSFLSGTQSEDYAPASGQITGILKTMHDEMTKDFAEEKAAELAAIKAYDELMAAKTKEVNALTKAIENKMTRVGELAVKIVQMKNDLGDTEAALIEDKKFLADLEKTCATKEAEWDEIVKTRNEELLALADTIKVLNDDDSLELFKKTLPGSANFIQLTAGSSSARARALAAIRTVRRSSKAYRPHLDFIALAIQGKKIGFEKVIGMIDEMVATLKTEQEDDDHKKEYCAKQFDLSDDKKKELERSISDLETVIADTKDAIATSKEEIAALEKSIKALDEAVAEATEQRKEENEDFTQLMASDSAAKEILGFAKNRLNKFYNPKLYKAPPKRELSDEDRATLAAGGTLAPTAAPGGIAGTGVTVLADVSQHSQDGSDAKPPPPPEAPGAYKKKSEESGGVIAMIDLLIKDLDKEMTVAKTEEKDAQADYEQMMKDSAEKRAGDAKNLADKEKTLADMQASLETDTETKASTTKELGATLQYIQSLHNECDWLLQYFEVRKEARTSEIDALGKAKAVLNGADYSLVQMGASKQERKFGFLSSA